MLDLMKSLTLDSVSMQRGGSGIMNSDLEYFDIVMHYKEIMKSTPGSRQAGRRARTMRPETSFFL
jgi:hypothetical protein